MLKSAPTKTKHRWQKRHTTAETVRRKRQHKKKQQQQQQQQEFSAKQKANQKQHNKTLQNQGIVFTNPKRTQQQQQNNINVAQTHNTYHPATFDVAQR